MDTSRRKGCPTLVVNLISVRILCIPALQSLSKLSLGVDCASLAGLPFARRAALRAGKHWCRSSATSPCADVGAGRCTSHLSSRKLEGGSRRNWTTSWPVLVTSQMGASRAFSWKGIPGAPSRGYTYKESYLPGTLPQMR